MRKYKPTLNNVLFLLTGMCVGIIIGFSGSYQKAEKYYSTLGVNLVSLLSNKKATTEAYYKAVSLIDKHYINNIDDNELRDRLLKGLIEGLDPHSSYIPPSQYTEFSQEMSGRYGGIGISINTENGYFEVDDVYEGSPAKLVGLKRGDILLKADDVDLDVANAEKSLAKIRGEIGTYVTITIKRENFDEYIRYKVKRDDIRYSSTSDKYYYSSDKLNRYGYIKLRQFKEHTVDDFLNSLDSLMEKNSEDYTGIDGLIVDLRGNPGGLVDQVVGVLSFFIDDKNRVLKIMERGEPDLMYYPNPYSYYKPVLKKQPKSAEEVFGNVDVMNDRIAYKIKEYKEKLRDKKLVVLIDRNSASASEIFAAAIKEWNRGVLIGERSFGKGSVQTVYDYGTDGGVIKLTTALYYTGKDQLIQEIGVTPNVDMDMGGERIREEDFDNHIKNPTVVNKNLQTKTLSEKIYTINNEYEKNKKTKNSKNKKDEILDKALEYLEGHRSNKKIN